MQAGHQHTYLKIIKKGMNHYVLGSTGGGEGLRGEIYGEFNHITSVLTGMTPSFTKYLL